VFSGTKAHSKCLVLIHETGSLICGRWKSDMCLQRYWRGSLDIRSCICHNQRNLRAGSPVPPAPSIDHDSHTQNAMIHRQFGKPVSDGVTRLIRNVCIRDKLSPTNTCLPNMRCSCLQTCCTVRQGRSPKLYTRCGKGALNQSLPKGRLNITTPLRTNFGLIYHEGILGGMRSL
jgi:hypothetical protein